MDEITFRSITPLFRFELEPQNDPFSIAGNHKNAKYDIKIVKPEPGPHFTDVLLPWANIKEKESIEQIHMSPIGVGGTADFFLIIDVTHDYTDDLEVAGNTRECVEIGQAVFDVLRLVSSKGLLYYNTYQFRSIPNPYGIGAGTHAPYMNQYLFSHLGIGQSVLYESDHTNHQKLIEKLLTGHHDTTKASDPLLELVLQYHQIAFKLEKVQHSFLILMIIFESLFKNPEENGIGKAAKRIGNKLGSIKAERKAIRREFDDKVDNTFGKIRNDIAHGISSLDLEIMETKYPALYSYVTRAIIQHIEDMKI